MNIFLLRYKENTLIFLIGDIYLTNRNSLCLVKGVPRKIHRKIIKSNRLVIFTLINLLIHIFIGPIL